MAVYFSKSLHCVILSNYVNEKQRVHIGPKEMDKFNLLPDK